MKQHPMAHSFTLSTCDDPQCGPHFIAEDHNGKIICGLVIPRATTLELIEQLQAILYSKVADSD